MLPIVYSCLVSAVAFAIASFWVGHRRASTETEHLPRDIEERSAA